MSHRRALELLDNVAVADAFQAMISDRPYRPALSKKDTIGEVIRYSGSQFDPVVAGVLVDVMNGQQNQRSSGKDTSGN